MGCSYSSTHKVGVEKPSTSVSQLSMSKSDFKLDSVSDNYPEVKDWEDIMQFSTFFSQSENPQIFEYLFLEKIGRGSSSDIYLVENVEKHEKFAAKVYSKSYLYRQNLCDQDMPVIQVNQEIQILSTISHPNCINLIEVIDDEYTNSLIIIQPYAELGSLLPQDQKTEPIPEDKAKIVFFQISRGLKEMHDQNIVHRDIKPENIFCFENGIVKLGDFSASAMLCASDDYIDDTSGTPAFYSPEQCTGDPYRAKPTDIWAMGVTLFMMLYGKLPFFDVADNGYFYTQFLTVANQIQTQPVVFPENISTTREAQDLILKCLDKNPEKRVTIDEILNHCWFDEIRTNFDQNLERLYCAE